MYWYVDGNLTVAYTGEGAQSENSDPMSIRLQLGVSGEDGSAWGGNYVPDAFPDEMRTDWVKSYAIIQ